jgi:hypothetical protein
MKSVADIFLNFYETTLLTYMKNGESTMVSCREKFKKNIADYHVLGLFVGKKHDLSEKNPFHTPPPVPLNAKFVTPAASPLKTSKLKFWLPEFFGPTKCPAYSEF